MAEVDETTADGGKPLTGRKVFAMFAGAFAVILGVNLILLWKAVGTFPGLEVENSYIANQTFDVERAAQEALGWETSAEVTRDSVYLTITGRDGKPAPVQAIEATIGRPTHQGEDQVLAFHQNESGVQVAKVEPLDSGNWDLRLMAVAMDGTAFRQRLQLFLPDR
ncbi:MAG: nitrogen fixation protein FixH [Rhodobacterales bacterium]|nr:MAG: nitrogen fixation protein FixH [Rhodobacterales bacterium]